MVKPQVYLDTTVPSALLDSRTPERQFYTKSFWYGSAENYNLVVSELVLQEIANVPDARRRDDLLALVANLERLSGNPQSGVLAAEYVKQGLFPERYFSDALHLALAVVHAVPILASWNFAHLVRRRTRQLANLINVQFGYGQVDIVTPAEL